MNLILLSKFDHVGIRPQDKLHGKQVGKLAFDIAVSLNYDEVFCNDVYVAGLLHDIGKKKLIQNIIEKQGQLSSRERQHVMKHVSYSVEEAKLLGVSDTVISYVKYHHEDYCGTGYFNLSGKIIPEGARLLRVCDFYDALISDRPYHTKVSPSTAIKIMYNNLHKLDPSFYKALIKLLLTKNML